MATFVRLLALAGVCLLGWNQALATCAIGVPHPTYYVGSDAQCKYTTIQAAITDVPSPTSCSPNIVVTNEHQPWNEALTIDGRSLTLIGLAGGCGVSSTHGPSGNPDSPATAPTSPQATISGAGKNAPVIRITGNSTVTVAGLEITGGQLPVDASSPSKGGGIYFSGAGSLTLNATTVDGNHADDGGGIAMSPSGSATLTLGPNALVLTNSARLVGGGILLEGQTRMYMLASLSTVSNNTATVYGGGIGILGPARADIGSSGAFLAGAVSNNSAAKGGGIAILASLNGGAAARLFSTSATQPVLVSYNTASTEGGAFYLQPDHNSIIYEHATLCANNYRIDNNSAPDGAAIFATTDFSGSDYGSSVYFNPSSDCGPESPASLGAVSCAAGTPCNEVSNNNAVDSSDMPSGSIITMSHYNELAVDRLAMHGNHANTMIDAEGPTNGTNNYLSTCLITDNNSAHELIHSDSGFDGEQLIVANCTLANNTIVNGYAIAAVGKFMLFDTIIDQPDRLTMYFTVGDCVLSPCSLLASYVMSNDVTTLPSNPNIVVGDPLFVDATNSNVGARDYHLLAYQQNGSITASPAIDFAPTVDGNAAYDLDGNPYGVDVPDVPDAYGTRDLGAYEMQPITDRVFAEGFGDRVSLVK